MTQDPEQAYAPIIFLISFIFMLVFIAMLLYLAWMIMDAESLNATRQQCLEMFFDNDSSTGGYIEELAGKCWDLLK